MEKYEDIAQDLTPLSYSQRTGYKIFKRIFDIFFSLSGIIILWPVMVVIAVMIAADSKGKVIFKQQRLGLLGEEFMMYKFRSMIINAEQNGPKWAQQDDDRVTKIGKFIRKTRLDELPQLINILKGEMSVVGPRPERAVFYDEFDTYIDGYRKRMLVKPGLTGWAQVNGGYFLGPEKKIVYDVEYMRNYSILMDFKIIAMTCKVIFTGHGAR